MTYQVLARKYRPQTFDEVIGQDTAVRTLQNAITHKRLHHAYLFCGARGVGKTSLARIFAKSLNCERGPTVTPCQSCSACVGITQGSSLDVLEIDGASNTGVDNIRELREQAKYLPAAGRYKIYIIDEVHMLSTSAFNALLKTLEEPPPHILFIFATTEPQKIPVTILSRCQRFDFKRLRAPLLLAHLSKILQQEKLTVPEESLSLIIHCSEGSVRDSLSLLDQVISFCGQDASPEKVREVLGLSDRVLLFEVLETLLKWDAKASLNKAREIYEKGVDLKIFCEELLHLIRHLLVLTEGGEKLIDLPPGDREQLKKMATQVPSSTYLMWFQILSRGTEEIARSDFPRMVFEVTLVKLIKSRELIPLSQVLDKIGTTEKPVGGRPEGGPPPRAEVLSTVGDAGLTGSAGFSQGMWHKFVKKVLDSRPQLGAILEHARPLVVAGDVLSLGFEPKSVYADMLKDRAESLQELAREFFKKAVTLDIRPLDQTIPANPTALEMRRAEEKKEEADLKTRILSDPLIQKAQSLLGATVKEIKKL